MSGVKCTDEGRVFTEREWARIQAREKREAQRQRRLAAVAAALFALVAALAFLVYYLVVRSHDYTLSMPYNKTDAVFGVGETLSAGSVAEPFARDLCVAGGDVNIQAASLGAYSAGLFDLNGERTVRQGYLYAALAGQRDQDHDRAGDAQVRQS